MDKLVSDNTCSIFLIFFDFLARSQLPDRLCVNNVMRSEDFMQRIQRYRDATKGGVGRFSGSIAEFTNTLITLWQ
jgi:hypothetical protein